MALENNRGNKLATFSVMLIGLFFIFLAFSFYTPMKESFQKPDVNEMRRYVLSQLTDEQLLQAKKDAAIESQKQKAFIAEEKRQQQERDRLKAIECQSNPTNEIRGHESCRRGIRSEYKQLVDENEILEYWLMYYCKLATSVRHAKELKCLPP